MVPLTAERRCSAGLGHQATEATLPPSSHTRTQRAVATSHSRIVPSADPDASHWPLASGATECTCRRASGLRAAAGAAQRRGAAPIK